MDEEGKQEKRKKTKDIYFVSYL